MEPQKKIIGNINFSDIDKIYVRNKFINYIKNDTHIGEYFKYGVYWEEWMFGYIKYYYKKNTNMIDIGSNIGSSALLMSEIVDENNKIFCFEPIFSDITYKNILDNNLQDKIVLFGCGLSDNNDVFKIDKIDTSKPENFGEKTINYKGEKTNKEQIEINIFCLDDFNITNISIIKIDVEGMEDKVLQGSYNTIEKNKPVILIEIHDLNNFKNKEIYKKLLKLGYKLETIDCGYNDYIFYI